MARHPLCVRVGVGKAVSEGFCRDGGGAGSFGGLTVMRFWSSAASQITSMGGMGVAMMEGEEGVDDVAALEAWDARVCARTLCVVTGM